MKSLKQYLAENKKVYSFKVKIAGEVPKNFEEDLKGKLAKVNVLTFEKMKSTPIQKTPLDFPTLSNAEVTIYNLVLEYPITPPEITNEIKSIGIDEEYFRVRGSGEPSETDQLLTPDHEGESLLTDSDYKDEVTIDQKELAGPEFNKSFLNDLAKAAKERAKELGHDNKNADVLGSHNPTKQDKAGAKSAVGSK